MNSENSAGDRHHLLFTGDSMLASDHWNTNPHSLQIRNLLSTSDLSVTNLEAPVDAGNAVPKWGANIHTSRSAVHTLGREYDVVGLANNHTMDYGLEGLEATLDSCENAGLSTVGAGHTSSEALSPHVVSLNNTSIALFSVAQREFGIAGPETPGVAWSHDPSIMLQIRNAAETNDFVFINAHGGVEHCPIPPITWVRHLRAMIDAGADAVIGHHPHVPQGWEIHDDAPIFYSLGNWLFHQPEYPATLRSYCVELIAKRGNLEDFTVHLTESQDGVVDKIPPGEAKEYRQYLTKSGKVAGERAHWQASAAKLFNTTYAPRLEDWPTGRLESALKHPVWGLDRLTRGITVEEERLEKDLAFLNYFQTESHDDVIRTLLELRTGVTTDERTPKVVEEVENLFGKVQSEDDQRVLEKSLRRAKKVLERIKNE
ncbi:CapA family protein [Haloprofundus marisrubri]|uniref:CapA family protein n=1 Tax=Haloprofundus marisrubri TaxID=1514971 RepID=UPI0009E30F00|nr:CapA family protein [Haloprofundus marisrubri]